MNELGHVLERDLLNPSTAVGAAFLALVFLGLALGLVAFVRSLARRVEPHLTDSTGIHFVSSFVQVLVFLVAFILYAHLIPELRALATALLAGVSVVSVVLGLAAQNTLGNLIAGLSLVLYRPIRVGDSVQLNTPKGLSTATVELVSLGYTILRDAERHEIIVPNGVMMSSVVIRISEKNGESGPNR